MSRAELIAPHEFANFTLQMNLDFSTIIMFCIELFESTSKVCLSSAGREGKNGSDTERILLKSPTRFPCEYYQTVLKIISVKCHFLCSNHHFFLSFPGACPLEVLYASLEKLKTEECLRHVEFVSADKEKYSSNLSLNARGGQRHSLLQAKTSPTVRTGNRTTTGLSPRPTALLKTGLTYL